MDHGHDKNAEQNHHAQARRFAGMNETMWMSVVTFLSCAASSGDDPLIDLKIRFEVRYSLKIVICRWSP